MPLSLMPSSFSTPEDKSIPNGLILDFISLIFPNFIPPERNQGLSNFKFWIIVQSKLFAFPPGSS